MPKIIFLPTKFESIQIFEQGNTCTHKANPERYNNHD